MSSIIGDRREGEYNLMNKNYGKAIFCFDKALKQDPHDVKSLEGKFKSAKALGKLYLSEEQFHDAIKYYEMSLEIFPDNVECIEGIYFAASHQSDISMDEGDC